MLPSIRHRPHAEAGVRSLSDMRAWPTLTTTHDLRMANAERNLSLVGVDSQPSLMVNRVDEAGDALDIAELHGQH